ncbi:MAG: hypothetical protein OEQ13_01325 [Acidobacteriota bacterium]|nr:hypothetical protein [Acidobacteriota bacterium]
MASDLTIRLLFRWLHVVTAVVAVGGLVFLRFVLLPAVQEALTPEQHAALRERLMRRWRIVVFASIAVLFVSGMYNFMAVSINKGRELPAYHMLFGIKFLAALGVFFLASIMAGRSAAFEPLRRRGGLWLGVTAALGVLVILLGGILHNLP